MSRHGRIAGVTLVALLLALLATVIGVLSTSAIVVGLALLAGTAWLGPRAVRVSGTLAAFVLGFVVARVMAGVPAGLACGAVGGPHPA